MKKTVCVVLGTMVLAAIAAVPLVAHHAFGGEFDPNRPILLRGAVTKVEWVNPHAWIHLAAKDVTIGGEKKALSGTEEWAVEGGTPNTLLRRGINRDSLTAGKGARTHQRV